MRKIVLACIAALLSSTLTHAQKSEVTYKSKQPYKSWVKMAPKLNDDFLKLKKPFVSVTMSYSTNRQQEDGRRIFTYLPNWMKRAGRSTV